MFSVKVAALALIAPLVSALTVTTPSGWNNAGDVTVTWTAAAGDPQTFDIQLINTAFNSQFALANNVPTGDGSRNLTLPQVPVGDGYTLELTAVGNITDVLTSSSGFAVGAQVSSSTTSTSTSSGTSSSSTSTSASTTRSSSSSSGTSSSASSTSSSFSGAASDFALSKSTLGGFAVMGAAALAGALVGF